MCCRFRFVTTRSIEGLCYKWKFKNLIEFLKKLASALIYINLKKNCYDAEIFTKLYIISLFTVNQYFIRYTFVINRYVRVCELVSVTCRC